MTTINLRTVLAHAEAGTLIRHNGRIYTGDGQDVTEIVQCNGIDCQYSHDCLFTVDDDGLVGLTALGEAEFAHLRPYGAVLTGGHSG
jgi:hypothetical protein